MEIKTPISNVNQEKLKKGHMAFFTQYQYVDLQAHSGTQAHIYTYMHAYLPGPVAQLATLQICNLSSFQGL